MHVLNTDILIPMFVLGLAFVLFATSVYKKSCSTSVFIITLLLTAIVKIWQDGCTCDFAPYWWILILGGTLTIAKSMFAHSTNPHIGKHHAEF